MYFGKGEIFLEDTRA